MMIQKLLQVLCSIKIQILCEILNGLKKPQQIHEPQPQILQENQGNNEEKTLLNNHEQPHDETLLENKITRKTKTLLKTRIEMIDDSKTSQRMMKLTVS
jgi:hypothetical protein